MALWDLNLSSLSLMLVFLVCCCFIAISAVPVPAHFEITILDQSEVQLDGYHRTNRREKNLTSPS